MLGEWGKSVVTLLERLMLHGERRELPRMLPVRLKPAAAVIERALALPEVHRRRFCLQHSCEDGARSLPSGLASSPVEVIRPLSRFAFPQFPHISCTHFHRRLLLLLLLLADLRGRIGTSGSVLKRYLRLLLQVTGRGCCNCYARMYSIETRHVSQLFQLDSQVLHPLACPLARGPLPAGHGDESVAQKLQMPSLQQSGTCWRPARKEVRRTIKSTAHMPAMLLLSSPITRPLSCTIMSMEYPVFGQQTSSSTDSPMWRSVSLTCCWVLSVCPRTPHDMSLSKTACP